MAHVNFWKFWNCPSKTRAISKLSKIAMVIYTKNRPNQTCDYWLITPNQQILCIETNIFYQRLITNQREGNCKTTGNHKITPLTMQCRLQVIVWLVTISYDYILQILSSNLFWAHFGPILLNFMEPFYIKNWSSGHSTIFACW